MARGRQHASFQAHCQGKMISHAPTKKKSQHNCTRLQKYWHEACKSVPKNNLPAILAIAAEYYSMKKCSQKEEKQLKIIYTDRDFTSCAYKLIRRVFSEYQELKQEKSLCKDQKLRLHSWITYSKYCKASKTCLKRYCYKKINFNSKDDAIR